MRGGLKSASNKISTDASQSDCSLSDVYVSRLVWTHKSDLITCNSVDSLRLDCLKDLMLKTDLICRPEEDLLGGSLVCI